MWIPQWLIRSLTPSRRHLFNTLKVLIWTNLTLLIMACQIACQPLGKDPNSHLDLDKCKCGRQDVARLYSSTSYPRWRTRQQGYDPTVSTRSSTARRRHLVSCCAAADTEPLKWSPRDATFKWPAVALHHLMRWAENMAWRGRRCVMFQITHLN